MSLSRRGEHREKSQIGYFAEAHLSCRVHDGSLPGLSTIADYVIQGSCDTLKAHVHIFT